MKRKRGRRQRDYSDDPDLPVIELALALQTAHDLSERMAIDLALALHQGTPGPATKRPRGAKAGAVIGYTLPNNRTFSSRNADIRRKHKAGKLRPNLVRVLYLARVLHDLARVLRAIHKMHALPRGKNTTLMDEG
jgi:hypothetical protein